VFKPSKELRLMVAEPTAPTAGEPTG
jgi:hypothetical protein